jgi:HK97 gp10 family phage protein
MSKLNTQIEGLSEVINNLRKVTPFLMEEQRAILEYAAVPLVDAIQRKVPVSTKVHYRYKRLGNGQFQKIAYHPGNLKKSIQILNLKKTKDVYIGPKVSKSAGASKYGSGKSVDGYYAHMVEFGTSHSRARPFMRPGFAEGAPVTMRRIERAYELRMKKLATKNNWNNE